MFKSFDLVILKSFTKKDLSSISITKGTGFASSHLHALPLDVVVCYTRKNTHSVTAFNSTDIGAEQDNVATPVTSMMATVCISTDIRPATEPM